MIRIVRAILNFEDAVCRVNVPEGSRFLDWRQSAFGGTMGDILYCYKHPEGSHYHEWRIHRLRIYRPVPGPKSEAWYFIGATEDYALFLDES